MTNNCWHTTARAPTGAPLYPDGDYVITVTAFDSHDNRASKSMPVTVANRKKQRRAWHEKNLLTANLG